MSLMIEQTPNRIRVYDRTGTCVIELTTDGVLVAATLPNGLFTYDEEGRPRSSLGGSVFIAPLPQKRTPRRRIVELYRGWRFKHSRRWKDIGLYTPDQ